jgi:hypothetical protein
MKLPIFFTKHHSDRMTTYAMIDQTGKEIKVECNYGDYAVITETHEIDGPKDLQDIIDRASMYSQVSIISEQVFMHHFSIAHREIFYNVNPQLRPYEEKQLG